MVGVDIALASLALDGMVGDPPHWPHPVRVMGGFIAFGDRTLHHGPGQRAKGTLLAVLTPLLFGGLTWILVSVGHHIWSPLGWTVAIGLGASSVAWRSLIEAGLGVYHKLHTEGLLAARREVGMIVGRDTDRLDEAGVIRAAVETLAENIVDGFVSPLFYGALGGAPFMVAYRSINTLDSMVGYNNTRYRDFGWASARLDDLVNWIPARLTVLLMLAVIPLFHLSVRRALYTLRRDARKHPSPNGGLPESIMAGALGVQLGGLNYYQGQPSERARLGDAVRPLAPDDIRVTLRVVGVTGLLIAVILAAWAVMPG